MALKTWVLANIVFLVIALVFAIPHTALACSCMAPPTTVEGIREIASKFSLVFTGVATGIDASGTIQFRVTKVYNGPKPGYISVKGAHARASSPDGLIMSTSCEWSPEIGPEYLIYAHSDSDGSYRTGLCNGNHVLPLSYEEQAALGGLVPSTPVTPLPPLAPASQCPNIFRTLSRGSSGSDVSTLQQYFVSIGYLGSSRVTGYFGPLTEGAVQEWQAMRGIVSSGSPATTGWGVGSSRVDLQACKLEYSIVSPK